MMNVSPVINSGQEKLTGKGRPSFLHAISKPLKPGVTGHSIITLKPFITSITFLSVPVDKTGRA